MNMLNRRIATVLAGLSLTAVSLPALGQAEDADPRQRELEEQVDRAILELFENLELGPEDPELDNDAAEERAREDELRRRVIRLQREQRFELVPNLPAGQAVEIDAKPLENPFDGEPREAVVEALGHEDFAVRESAEAILLTDNTLGKAEIKALIDAADSPEVRQRLLRVAEHHVLREMRERDFGANARPADPELPRVQLDPAPASIGYSYEPVMAHENPQMQVPGVRVIATMPGFPGYAHLRQGDIIVQIAGQGLSPNHQHHDITNWVRWRISAHAAGDTMAMTVLRGGEAIQIELVCAQGMALDHMYTTDAFETAARKEPYKQQWRQARAELVKGLPKPKVLTPTALDAAEEKDRRGRHTIPNPRAPWTYCPDRVCVL